MLHLRVHGHGEVIRVLLISLELGRTNLPSFLQVPREREGEAFHVETEAEGTPIRVKQKGGALIRVKPPSRGSRIEAPLLLHADRGASFCFYFYVERVSLSLPRHLQERRKVRSPKL